MKDTIDHLDNVDRVELIDDEGRQYVAGSIYGTPVKVALSTQDDGKTLKIFVSKITRDKTKGVEEVEK